MKGIRMGSFFCDYNSIYLLLSNVKNSKNKKKRLKSGKVF